MPDQYQLQETMRGQMQDASRANNPYGFSSPSQGFTAGVYANPGGGGGGFSGSGLQDILKQLQAAQDKANTANEKRYQDILSSYSNLGQAGMTRIGQQEQQAQAKNTQDLTSRGLGNTTITSATNRGIANDAELQRQQLQESVAQIKGGVMERKTEQGPDLSMYANLLQGAAQGGGGGGGSMYNQLLSQYGMGTHITMAR